MVAPLLQAQIDNDAPPAKVWDLVADLRRMPEWSPQCRWMKAFGPLRPGTRTLNLNRRFHAYWPTTATIVEVIPQQKLGFRIGTNRTIWSYELEPRDHGTRVVESRHAENGVTAYSNMAINLLFGRTANFERELVEGMNASLAKIKAATENG
ncbi:SRPBCC family protein [Mycobacterium tilburgii]|uniref:SRPBCC family protein n=1 Tax=Mycobacterium tilburgii TaxID=44467 RepID=UPI0011839F5E|nr:SRPBCC family protein [Mycobacterium tilburgii]